jgi:membrane protein YdbS with pleckstrin-like domain
MSNIIEFKTASERPVSSSSVAPPEIFPETRRQRASQRRNPMRRLYGQTAIAVTIAGKLHRGEALRVDQRIDEIKWLRQGAEAARRLAEELAPLVEQMEAGS